MVGVIMLKASSHSLGFSPEWKSYREKIKRRLNWVAISASWGGRSNASIEEARFIQDWSARVAAFRDIV
jgi:hypothetical protein